MLISDILPYPRNARHNERAIPKVAESIKEFGLRGTIGLESKENPVIVFGHTRIEACKSLGWTEIPDAKIEFCDFDYGKTKLIELKANTSFGG